MEPRITLALLSFAFLVLGGLQFFWLNKQYQNMDTDNETQHKLARKSVNRIKIGIASIGFGTLFAAMAILL
ncbi:MULTISPECIES: hypothetical protein [Alteribacter]|uniref:Uncharacterized protein n=1 Tax=Alteribacter keqinensis TaxID=2483800 RepID=A0A3M7TNL8_9BACI|nr:MULTISPECIES: hypothetical protein [Alteribacter]MBM7095242.1 hypothetical protein [Alteribacter salitolerans]RNA66988.1 hypothetical protein EBO34_17495 [Alteribacter keqinensis]